MNDIYEYSEEFFEFDDSAVGLYGKEYATVLGGETVYYREGTWYEKSDEGGTSQTSLLLGFIKTRSILNSICTMSRIHLKQHCIT